MAVSSATVLSGLRPWLIQRISAVYIALFIVYTVVTLAGVNEVSYLQWRDWLLHPFNTIAAGLVVIALLMQASVGIRDIIHE